MSRLSNWRMESVSGGGTGNLTLAGASAGYVPLSAGAVLGDAVPYVLEDTAVNAREAGFGRLLSATTFERTVIEEKVEAGVLTIRPATGINVTGGSTFIKVTDIAQMHPSSSSVSPAASYLQIPSGNWGVKSMISPFNGLIYSSTGGGWFSTGSGYQPWAANLVPYANTQGFAPFRTTVGGWLTGLSLGVNVAGAAGTLMRLALYACRPDSGLPGKCLFDGGTLPTSAATWNNAAWGTTTGGTPIYLPPGNYWLSFVFDTTATLKVSNALIHEQFCGMATPISPVFGYWGAASAVTTGQATLPDNPTIATAVAGYNSGQPHGLIVFGGA